MTNAVKSAIDPKVRGLVQAGMALQRHPNPEVREVGWAIHDWWWSGATQPLEQWLGVRGAPGRRSVATVVLLAKRDELVRLAAEEFYPDLVKSATAARLHPAWLRYASSAWPRERLLDRLPRHRSSTIEAVFWDAMKLQDRVPSERTIRSILAAS